jgi:glycosyltransferase involved in cell wall biosynthesis
VIVRILFLHEVNYLEKPIFEMHEFPEHLTALGHEVGFVQFPEGSSSSEVRALGWKAKVSGRVLPNQDLTLYTPQNAAGNLLGRLKTALTFKRSFTLVVKDFSPDVVVSFSVPTSGWQALAVSKKLRIPFVFRALDVSHLIRKSVFSRLILSAERFIYRNASAVSANNPAMADYCLNMGAALAKTFVDLPPIDLSHFADGQSHRDQVRSKLGISAESKVIIYMGSFFYFSGLPKLVDEFERSAEKDNVLVLVGGGEQDQELRQQVAKLGLANKVLFTGFVDFNQLPSYLAAADVAVNPMQSSLVSNAAFPNKVIQYLATGLAVATTRLKGLELTFGDVPGIRYSETPEQVMRDALDMSSSPELDALGRANQALVAEKFSKVEAVKAFEKRLREVVEHND